MSEPGRLELRARARLGTTIKGKYRLDSVLGTGGMATVYRATHRNQAELAVKMLHPEISIDEDIRQRFLREGFAANSVKHAGVVSVVDEDVTEDGSAFLVMELLHGASAEDLVARGRLPPEIASAIGIQLLDVLASAHAHGVLHRDIKPANVFVTDTGAIKVLDFGIARVREAPGASARLTATGMSFGTPAFMPPEQARGKSRELREPTDLFAVGATLFTLVTGELVHLAETSAEAMIKAATEPPRRLASVAPEIPHALAKVIDRALEFSADARWPSAVEMREALLAAHRGAFGEPSLALLAAYVAEKATKRVDVELPTRPAFPNPPEVSLGATTTPITAKKPRVTRRRNVLIAATAMASVSAIAALALSTRAKPATEDAHLASAPPTHVSTPLPSSERVVTMPTVVAIDEPTSTATAVRVTDLPKPKATSAAIQTKPPAASSASSAPNCDPRFTVDRDGVKHFKPECY